MPDPKAGGPIAEPRKGNGGAGHGWCARCRCWWSRWPLRRCGRGLLIVEALADRWTVVDRRTGKTVRAELRIRSLLLVRAALRS